MNKRTKPDRSARPVRFKPQPILNTLGLIVLDIIAIGWAIPMLWAVAVSVHPPDEPLSAANL